MLKSILVGLDGSPYTSAATELGIQWAKQFDALLVGLGVVDEEHGGEPVPIGGGAYKRRLDRSRSHGNRVKVEEMLQQFSLRCGEAQVASKQLEEPGEAWKRILVEAQRYDLILLGQQTFFDSDAPDSPCDTLQQVLKHSPRPVVTVPNQPVTGSSVVVAYDGSLQAARVLQAFQHSGLHTGREVHLVCLAEESLAAARHTDRAAEFLRFHGVQAAVHPQQRSGDFAAGILEQVRERNAGLLVMGAYGQPILREFILGSVTRSILQESPVPLFLYH